MLIETSRDLLNIILSICIVWVSIFLCWSMYHAVRAIRDLRAIAKNLRISSEAVVHFANEFKTRILETASAASGKIVTGAAETVVDSITNAINKFGKKRKKSKK